MLPFLPNQRTQTIIMGRKEEGKPMELPAEDHPLTPAMEDFMEAHKNGDPHKMAQAFQAAHEMMTSMPDNEDQGEDA